MEGHAISNRLFTFKDVFFLVYCLKMPVTINPKNNNNTQVKVYKRCGIRLSLFIPDDK